MQLSLTILATTCVGLTSGFSAVQPRSPLVVVSGRTTQWPRHMATSGDSLDEEVEAMVQEEIRVTKKISNLRNKNGVEYAPWMGISREDEAKIRAQMRDKAEARRRRQLQEQDVRGALLNDSQAQELSGTGLRGKIIDGNSVELEWGTSSEASTLGFLIKRRAAKSPDFETIASYETYGKLASQGPQGGVYRYLDEEVPPGGYFYRVTECETSGEENDLSQCLVEIQTQEEQRVTLFAAVGVVTVLLAAVVAGTILDPVQY